MTTTSTAGFDALERTVIRLARDERGRGGLPESGLVRLLRRIHDRLSPEPYVRPLANARLEALRLFVNAVDRAGRVRIGDARRLILAGYSATQMQRLARQLSTKTA